MKGLVVKNTHVKYEIPSSYGIKVMANVKSKHVKTCLQYRMEVHVHQITFKPITFKYITLQVTRVGPTRFMPC